MEPQIKMVDVYHLKPYGFGAEGLRVVNIDFNQCSAPIILGRNSLTGLETSTINHVQGVSRAHAEVTMISGKLYISAKSKQDELVCRNGSPIPRDIPCQICCGDKICLVGPMQLFNYEVMDGTISAEDIERSHQPRLNFEVKPVATTPIIKKRKSEVPGLTTTINSSTTLKVSKPPSSSNDTSSSSSVPAINVTLAIRPETAAKLESHYECSICFCPMACCHSISPCGHSFCYSCIADWASKHKTCPFCLGPFLMQNSLPNITIEGIIREILTMDPNPDSLASWEERAREGLDLKRGVKKSRLGGSGAVVRFNLSNNRPIPIPAVAPRTLRSSPARAQDQAGVGISGSSAVVAPADVVNAAIGQDRPSGPAARRAAQAAALLAARSIPSESSFVDLTDDVSVPSNNVSRTPSAGLLRLQSDRTLERIIEVSYSAERNSCAVCRSEIRPSKVQVCVSALGLVEKMFFHTACMVSPLYSDMHVSYEAIIGKNSLKEKDINILKSISAIDS